MWLLKIELRTSRREVSVLNHWAIFFSEFLSKDIFLFPKTHSSMIVCVKFMPQSISRDLISGLFITVLQNINQSQLINISHGSRKVEKVMLQIQVQFCWLHSFNTFFFVAIVHPQLGEGFWGRDIWEQGKQMTWSQILDWYCLCSDIQTSLQLPFFPLFFIGYFLYLHFKC